MSEVASKDIVELKPVAETRAIVPLDMLNTAVQAGQDVEVLEKLMGLHERWEANNARKAFDNAMAGLRENLPAIPKSKNVKYQNKDNSWTDYWHETLNDVTSAISPLMAEHGLSFYWDTDQRDQLVVVTCHVTHREGYSKPTTLKAAPDTSGGKGGIHSLGSTVTYLQRYTLKAAVGLAAADDDDGRGGGEVSSFDGQPIETTKQAMPKGQSRDLYTELQQDIDSADSKESLQVWGAERRADVSSLPPDWQNELRNRYLEKMHTFHNGESYDQYQ